MKRIYLAIIFSVFCLALLVLQYFYFKDTPTPFEKSEKVAKISLISEPLSLDPRKSSDGVTSQFFNFCYDGLTRRTFDGKIELSLAKSFKVGKKGRRYEFTLREAYWSNGELLTAYDFEYSWKKILDKSFLAHNPEYMFNIKHAKKAYQSQKDFEKVGVKAEGSSKLVITLEEADPYFLELISNKSFFPINRRIDLKHPNWSDLTLKHFVGCGPFVIKRWFHRNKISLKKNPYYWDEQNVQLDGVELYIIEDEMTQISMYESKELDWIGAPLSLLPVDALSKLKNSPNFGSYRSSSLYFCCFNTEAYPLNNPKIRKALTLAINRKDLVDYVSHGGEEIALSLLPRTMHADKQNYFEDGDLVKAKELLQEGMLELGLSKESFPKIVYSFPNIHSRRLLAQALQQQWEKALGIKISLQSTEWQVFLSDIKSKKYQMAGITRATQHLDPLYFLALFKKKNQLVNYAHWESKKFQDLLLEAKKAPDIKSRKYFISKAEEIFMDEMPVAPIFFPMNYYLKQPHLKKVLITPVGSLDFKWATLD